MIRSEGAWFARERPGMIAAIRDEAGAHVGESLRIEVPNTRQGLASASAQADAWTETHAVPPKASYLALLAIEELVTNCIEYGYDDAAEHVIEIDISIANGVLSMMFIDDGHAFNPLAAAAPDPSLEVEERPIGGLGIHMLRKLSDSMEYERRDGTNRVTLTKHME